MGTIMYMTRRTNHLLNKGEGNLVMSAIHVMDNCPSEEESWQVGRRLELGGMFSLQGKEKHSVHGRTIK